MDDRPERPDEIAAGFDQAAAEEPQPQVASSPPDCPPSKRAGDDGEAHDQPAGDGGDGSGDERQKQTSQSKLCTDPDAFFRLLYKPGDVWEVRAFQCPVFSGATKKRTASGYFANPQPAAMYARYIDAKRRPPGVYFTLNPVIPDLLGRSRNQINYEAENTTTDEQIVCRRWLLLDIDPVRSPGLSATDDEARAAGALATHVRNELAKDGWPEPLHVMSGNGCYLLYRLDDVPNDNNSTDLIRRVLHGLGNRFDNSAAKIDRSTFNASRIIKVPGTTARKGDDFKGTSTTQARPHRVAGFRVPDGKLLPVPIELLHAAAVRPEEMKPAPHHGNGQALNSKARSRGRGGASALNRCRAYIAKMPAAVSGQGGHNATLNVACEAFRFGLSEAEAAGVLAEFNQRCVPPWGEADLEHKLADALAKVNAGGEFGIRLASPDLRRASSPLPTNLEDGEQEIPTDGTEGTESLDLMEPEGQTDTANARRLITRHGADIRWCDVWKKWLTWDGKRWVIDAQLKVEALAKDTAGDLWNEIGPMLPGIDSGPYGKMLKFVAATSNGRGISNMIDLARSEPGIPILHDQLDTDPWLLNVSNGTIDLRSGKLLPHDKADLITKLCPVAYDPDAECPRWRQFVAEIMGGDKELVGFLRRLAGYWLTGSVRDHVLPIFYGKGSNGKTVFLNTIETLLGTDYAMHSPRDFLLIKKHESHPTERADLFGMRLVISVETPAGRQLDEALVKELTGNEPIRARRCKEDFWQFSPTHKLVQSSNYRPIVRGMDDGIWRRLALVPFNVRFWNELKGETGPPELRQDPHLSETLLGELPGILNWLLLGCAEWQAEGLSFPRSVLAATDDYRRESDILAGFFDECCLIEPESITSAGRLYEAYCGWCKTNGHDPDNSTVFGRKLTERGFQVVKKGGNKFRLGITLRSVPTTEFLPS